MAGPIRKDLTDLQFGRLKVLEFDHRDSHGAAHWRCVCDCGNEVVVRGSSLTSGATTSCGCYVRENNKRLNTKHGGYGTSLYHVWVNIKQRCNNPNDTRYKNYGKRGIFICNEWDDFEIFRNWALDNGYKEGLTIDRINVNDGYYPENCRWTDWITQENNKRNNSYITWGEETHTIAEWARIFGVNYNSLVQRIRRDHNMRDFEEYFRKETHE